ncbi:hypothetical protein RHGRI_014476 [Rhododendron griersonianum]|uniref:CCHC-type domain-containing protein n=1 Tax=Rhododendron griersonianum TaxID=479676 RepID=A0AAV6K9G4_9ERIC|nr:hypothetical protein RHGRI_014476 [Rhododendron griersonianum]
MLKEVVDPLDGLEMIDDLQRLGVFYHFEDEIKRVLESIYNNNKHDKWNEDDLHATYERIFRVCYKCGRIGHSNNACNSSLVEALDSLHQRYNESPFSSTFPLILENNKPMFSPSLRALRNTDCNRTSRIWVLYEDEVQNMEMDENLVFNVDITDSHSSDEIHHTPEGETSLPPVQPVGDPVPPPVQGSSSWWQSAISMFSPHFPSPINPPQPHNISHNITPSQPTPNFFDHQPLFDQTTALHATTTNPSPLLTLSPPISLAEAVPTTTTTQPTQPSLPFVTQTFTHAPLINESQADLAPITIPSKVSEVFRCSAPDFFGDDSLAISDSHSLKSTQDGPGPFLSNAIKQQSPLSKKRSSSSSSDADSPQGGKRSKLVQLNQREQPPGHFNACLCKDIRGMLYLYEASFLSFRGESTLEEARDFATKNLEQDIKRKDIDQDLASLVSHALELPLHWRMPRLEARWFIDLCERRPNMNPVLLQLAKLDFNMVQATHQEDLKHMSRWWSKIGLAKKLGFARDRLMENFLWTIGLNFKPQFSNLRRNITVVNALITTIDDVYDVYGTLDELEIFTNAIERLVAVVYIFDILNMIYS